MRTMQGAIARSLSCAITGVLLAAGCAGTDDPPVHKRDAAEAADANADTRSPNDAMGRVDAPPTDRSASDANAPERDAGFSDLGDARIAPDMSDDSSIAMDVLSDTTNAQDGTIDSRAPDMTLDLGRVDATVDASADVAVDAQVGCPDDCVRCFPGTSTCSECLNAGECASGHCECADASCEKRVCSAVACDGCSFVSAAGTCSGNIAFGLDPNDVCADAFACNGQGACLLCNNLCAWDELCFEGSCAALKNLPMQYQPLNFPEKPFWDYAPNVLWDDELQQWVMYHCGYFDYGGSADGGGDAIWRSTSANGWDWTLDPTPVLQRGVASAWDGRHICDPSVIKLTDGTTSIDGATWMLWYTGVDADDTSDGLKNEIGLALSRDGKTWTKLATPVIGGSQCTVPQSGSPAYGCGQTSVVKDGALFYMTHTEIRCPNSQPECRLVRFRTSADGINWNQGELHAMPNRNVGPEMMKVGDRWYFSTLGNARCGLAQGNAASEILVYAADSFTAPQRLVGCLADTDIDGQRHWLAEQGFYRDGMGHRPARSPDIWIAFGMASGGFHAASEQIHGARLALVDGESGAVEGLWSGQACAGSGISQTPFAHAWSADGPLGDDLVYWDVTSDGDGSDEYCDSRLAGFANTDFSGASAIEVRWHGTSTRAGNVGFSLHLKNGSANYVRLGDALAQDNVVTTTRFNLPAGRSDVRELLFRVSESDFSDVSIGGQHTRIHIRSVSLKP